MQIAPKEDELKSLQTYTGPLAALSPPERFLVMLARIPRVSDKMNLLLLRKTFRVLPLTGIDLRGTKLFWTASLLSSPCCKGSDWRTAW